MSEKTKQASTPPGTLFEYRIARLRFWQGYFVRRSIDVWPSGSDGDKLAELDAITVTFDPQLRRSIEIIECKTTSGRQGEIDRLLWLKGVGAWTKARSVTFAKSKLAGRTRTFARQIDVDAIDEAFVKTAERDLGLSVDQWVGFHDPVFGENTVKPARSVLSASHELKHAGKYLFGSFWFTDDFSRIKQLRTFFRLLVENQNILPKPAFLLGLGEATTLFTFAALSIATWKHQMPDDVFSEMIADELSTGLGDRRNLRNFIHGIDQLQREQIESVHAAYQAAGAGRIAFTTRNLEQEILTPPEWIDGFIDLVSRFARRPHIATQILQWTDLWAAKILGAPNVPEIDALLFAGYEKSLNNAFDLTKTFLTRFWNVPSEFFNQNLRSELTGVSATHNQSSENSSQDIL